MFEAQVVGLLQRYLGKYVYGLDAESLRISVWRGDVELRNLRLKPEALEELNLPVTVKSGLLGRLTLKVPWSKLGKEPVVAEFDRLYIVACPREDDSTQNASPDSADAAERAEEIEAAAKRQRVAKAEEAWLEEVAAKDATAESAGSNNSSAGGGGMFRALIDTIIGNLELHITNVHIRYEDTTSNPGHSFCIGVMLQEISGHTANAEWQRAFVTSDALKILRKSVKLQSLAVYLDCDVPLLEPGKRWDLITRERWDELLLPVNHTQGCSAPDGQTGAVCSQSHTGGPGQHLHEHQFLLCPVDGTLRYVRRGKQARLLETDAEQEMHLQLKHISVRLHQLQYQSGQKLAQEFDRYAASAPHRNLRPHCRPAAGAGARLWWRYAITVVKRQQQTYTSRAWQQLREVAVYNKEYVPAYVRHLQAGKPASEDRAIAAMDKDLDESVILLFRRLAHAKYKAAKAKTAAAEAGKQQHQQQGWFGWLMGSGQRPSHQAVQQSPAAAESAAAAGEISLGVDEWNTLEDLLSQQAAALGEDQKDTPTTVKSIMTVKVDVAAMELQEGSGRLIMQAALGGVDSRVVAYPQAQDVNFCVSKFGVTSSHGPLINSGVITTTSKTATPAVTAAAAAQGKTAAGSKAMSLRVLRNPQDGSADLLVQLALAPSYVTYNKTAIQDVAGFFKSEESLELSRLQAQAAARTDKLRHMAQLQLKALSERSMEQKPRMRLYMTLHAPKVAVPDAAGTNTLIADLGCFTIRTNTQASQTLSKEEAAIYEAFVVKVDHVSAYLLDGPFSWPSNDELIAATAAVETEPRGPPDVFVGSQQQQAGMAVTVLQGLLARRARVVPLLDRFGLGMDLQVATSVHPRYPVMRVAISASPLKLHLSPYRYQQLMMVLQSLSGAPAAPAEGAGTPAEASPTSDKPLWMTEAEYATKVAVLAWEGMGSRAAKWQSHRWAHVWRGRVYITPHREDPEVCLTRTYWMGYRVVMVPPAAVGGSENVLAIIPKNVKTDAVTESPDAVIMKAPDATTAIELRKRLMASANQMAAVAGLLDLGEADDQDAAIGTTKDVLDELFSHQQLLQLYGSISEMSLLISGRAPVSWWPPSNIEALPSNTSITSSLSATPTTTPGSAGPSGGFIAPPSPEPSAATTAAALATVNSVTATPSTSSQSGVAMLVPLEEEVSLVAIKFQGAQVGVTVSGDGFMTEVAMAALTMDDLLVGAKNPEKAHMARSSIDWDKQQQDRQAQAPMPSPPTAADATQLPDAPAVSLAGAPPSADAPGGSPGPQSPTEDDEEFFDAEEGDPSTPRIGKRRLSSGSGSSLASAGATSTVTSIDEADAANARVSSGSGGQVAATANARLAAAAAAGQPVHSSLSLVEGFGLDVDDTSFIAAPSFVSAMRSFTEARGSQGLGGLESQSSSRESSGVGQKIADTAAPDNTATSREGKEELVRLLFARYSPTSTSYKGLDVEVVLKLSTLVFYCNRPTVAALMVFGTDLGAINGLLAAPADDQQESSEGPDAGAAAETATIDSESVSDIQLVRGGGEQRILFKLTLQVAKVELHLNYEGDIATPLAIGSIDNFMLKLALHPATLQLDASLGNLVAEYGSLAVGHPNRVMVSMRDKQAGSLIEVAFRMHSVEESFLEKRVPGGMQYMSVVTHLSTVQIIFMNKFLVEFLDYLAAMLAMQAKPTQHIQQPEPAQQQQPQQPAQQQTASSAASADSKPLVLLLDVELDAPVLLMPLLSSSDDHVEVDLGTLQLSNRVVWEMHTDDKQKLLMDEMEVTLQKVSGCVVENHKRGRNVIREMGGGVNVFIRRALMADPLPLPPVTTAVSVPKLRASLLDTEYALILAVISSNFGEAADIPRSIAWLHQQLLPDPLVAAAAVGAGGAAVSAAASSIAANSPTKTSEGIKDSTPTAAAGGTAGTTEQDVDLKRSVVANFGCTNASLLSVLCDLPSVKSTVSIGQAQLMLWNAQPEGIPPAAVGSIEFSNMWVSVNNTHGGNMLLSLSLPSVCARDLRPGVPKEASLVLSTAEVGARTAAAASLSGTGAIPLPTGCPKNRAAPDGGTASESCKQDGSCSTSSCGPGASLLPSLLTLEYRQVRSLGPEPVSALQVRLQRPTLVLDVGFIMKVLHFVAPTAGLQGPVPRPFETREVHLGPEPYTATDHLWLSPEYRIIADAPGLKEAVYDGGGYALVLPDSVPAIEHVPLIVVGRGKTLRLKNVRIINKQSLAGVLLLGPGARLIAEEQDGVTWHSGEELARLRNKYGRHIFSKVSKANQAAEQQQPAPAGGSMTIAVHAIGAAIYLVDAHSVAEQPTLQDVHAGRATPSALAVATTPPSSEARQQQGSSSSSEDEDSSVGGLEGLGPSESVRGSSGGVADAGSNQAEVLRMLAMYLDLGLDLMFQGDDADITAQLQGLCIKAQARLLEDASAATAAADAAAADNDSNNKDASATKAKSPSSQEVATGILEPCDVKVVMKQSKAVQDLGIDISALQLRVSPDVMQLILHLQQVVLEPLAVPATSQPLSRVDKFSFLWCSHEAADTSSTSYAAAGAGGVDLLGSDKGVTAWRPQPPTGYAIVGDVLSAGHSQPDHQIIAIAINSGLVTYPTGYTLAWESSGISFWRPIPPAGYVAMGCLGSLSTGTAKPAVPSRKACVVVAKQAVVEALLAECMMLCTNGNLWCIQNSTGTFEVASPDSHQPQVPLYDLRSPLGVAPYALTPLQHHTHTAAGQQSNSLLPVNLSPFSYMAPPPSLVAARIFAVDRAALRAKVARSGQVTTTVEFARIWWDKHSKHPSMTKVSFWRPVPPPGYVVLGDCMVPGMYCPPQNVLVVRDTDPSETVAGQPPLLARPLKYVPVWVDGHKKARGDSSYLTLWKPIAPAGYVAMGLLASLGGREPASLERVRCVRADMVARVDLQPSDPALIFYPYKQRPGLGGWVADDRASTFVVVSHDGSPQLLEAFRLKDVEEQRNSKKAAADDQADFPSGPASRALQLSVAVGKTNLLLRNLLRTPILELEAANINVGLSQEPCGVRRCFAYLTTSLWSYHQSLEVWEPIMEPWQLLLHMDVNPNSYSSAGIAPGTWIRLTSPQGSVHVTLAQSALVYALDAMTDWQGIVEASPPGAAKAKRQGLAATDGMTVYTTINNTLGVPAYVQLDYGEGHKEVVVLRPHAVTPITQPMPVPPMSHAPLTAGPPPPMRLVVDVLDGKLLAGLGGTGSVPELYVKVEVAGKLKQQLADATQGMTTRAVPVHVSLLPSAQASPTAQQGTEVVAGQTLQWNERFVLALPPELAEQLLTPAPGDNPFEGVAIELRATVYDGSGDKGLGRVVSRSNLQIQYTWLLGQVQAVLGLRQVSAGAATVATAAAGHRRALSQVAAGAAAAATELGETYTLDLKAAAGDGSNAGSAASSEEDDTLMQLQVAVSLDDSQVSSSWYPHQRMRRQLARVLGIASSTRDGARKLSATSNLARPSSANGQKFMSLAGAAGSQKHALRLEGSDVWSPFSYTSLRRLTGSTSGPHTGIVPIRAGQGLVMELSYTGGQYSARIRSLCQFVNSTDMTLEVALLEEDDSAWTMLPYTASSGGSSPLSGQKRPAVGELVEEEVFEYERYLPLRGWSPDHLKGLDPHRYSRQRDGGKGSSTFPKVPLPQGWEWEGPWEVEIHGNVDPDGWAYAFEPRQFRWPPEPGAGIKKAHDFVRRRRLVRKRRRVALPSSVLDMSAAGQSTGGAPSTAGGGSGEQWQRRVLGRVEPGGSVPLPQDWRSDNKQLQVRPILPPQQTPGLSSSLSISDTPSHAWSYGVSSGQHSVQLASMEDGASRLLCCKTLGQTPEEPAPVDEPHTATSLSPRKAAAAAPSCWFSTTCEANELVLQGGMDVLTDWTINAQPPLTLQNDLPVAAHYVLWERAARGGSLVLRQQGYLEGGASVNVYSVDMRQQVCLTFHPEGSEWAEPEPVLVSEGFLGSTAGVDPNATQLPDSFCVRYSNSQSVNTRLRIALNRHMDTELLDSQRIRAAAARATAGGSSSGAAAAAALADGSSDAWRMSYGTALAQGRPLVLALSVPVWVVNGTQLPISVGIVQLDTTDNGDNTTGLPTSGDPATADGTFGQVGQLRVLDTEAYSQTMRPNSSVTIMGNSVELLSYPGEGPDGSGSRSQSAGLANLRAAADPSAPGNTVVQQWAAVLSVMGSRWSSPLVLAAASNAGGLPGAEPGSAPVAEAVARQLRYDPVIVRAKCKDGCVYDITVRIESAGTGLPLSTVVRLDPHMVVSNRTGYILQLVQPEPIWKVLGSAVAAATGGMLSSGSSSVGSFTSSTPPSAAWFAGSAGSDPGRRGPASAASSTPVKDSTVVLRPGSLAVPMSWPHGCVRRLLLLTLPPAGAALASRGSLGGTAGGPETVDPVMWSEPFRVEYPATGLMQVLLPLYRLGSPGQPQQVNAQTLAAAHQAFKALFQPVQQSVAAAAAAAGKPPMSPSATQRSSPSKLQGGQPAAENGPLLIHVAKRTEAGLLEYLAVTVNISVEMPLPGCLHMILQSLGGEPQHCLMNCTGVPISYRQATPKAAWQVLPPYSGAALVLLQPAGGLTGMLSPSGGDPLLLPSCSEVELRDGDPQTSGSAVCNLDTDSSGIAISQGAGKRSGSGGAGGRSSGEAPSVFPIAGGKAQALAQVLPLLESVMAPGGPAEVPGAGSVALGRTQTDRLLRVLPKIGSVSMNQLRLAATIAGQDQARLSPASAMHLSLELPSLDLSLVDGRPQELMLLNLDGLTAEYHAGNSAGVTYNQMLIRVNLAQVDDMLHGTPFPVLLVPADKTVLEDSAADPLLFFTYVSQPSRLRGALYTPTIAGRIAALSLQLSETLAWRMFALAQGLASPGSSSTGAAAGVGASSSTAAGPAGTGLKGSGYKSVSASRERLPTVASAGNLPAAAAAAGAGAGGGGTAGRGSSAAGVQQVANADLPLQVDLLSVDDLPLRVSFRTDKSNRPRWANQMWVFNTLGDMLNFDDLQLTLPGLELEGQRAARSALIGHALKQLQAQALAIAFNVFRSYGVLGTATKLLMVGSNITSAITGTSSGALGSGSASTTPVTNVGQGFLEGGRTFGEGLLKGVTGIVADPLAGAKQGGVLGFMSGTVRGLVGVPGQIIGGALSAASKVTEGMDATYKEVKGQLTAADQRVVSRRRLPRCIRGDGVLTPYSVIPAMGLALLYNSGAGSVDSLVKGASGNFLRSSGHRLRNKDGLSDSYETHMTLPGGNVAIITNMRLLMVQAEMFAQLEAEVEAGRRLVVNSVPAGRLLWQLTWDQMLSAELAYHRQQPGAPPDGVIVHRKNRSEDGDVLVHDVRCNPNNNQALRLYEALSAARQKYYIQPRREAIGWKVTPVIAAEQQDNQEMPDVMLSMDFKRIWKSARPGARPLSIWRPVGPPGYAPLGDVAMPGNEPPARPVSMYRDVQQDPAAQDPAAGLSDLPALSLPERYQLVFRDSGSGNSSAMSLWRPIAPNGYLEVGYVVVPAIEEPPLGIVRCMRSDLMKQGRLFDYPVWSDTSSDNMYWQCSIWQVDNSCCTFVAVKSTNKPHPHTARAPLY